MRKVYNVIALLILASVTGQAQLLSVSPAFPKDTGAVTITADFSLGNKGLFNYGNTNDVYVHIGVITSASTGPSDWKYVRFAWGTTNDTARAVSLGNNRYSYHIDTIRSFFKVPAAETILKIAILFRNGSGGQVQRNADGGDMYLSVYTSALAGKFTEPFFQPKYDPVPEPITKNVGDNLPVTYAGSNADTLRLYFNGAKIAEAQNANSVSANPAIPAAGLHTVVGVAITGAVMVSDTFRFFVAPPVTIFIDVRQIEHAGAHIKHLMGPVQQSLSVEIPVGQAPQTNGGNWIIE